MSDRRRRPLSQVLTPDTGRPADGTVFVWRVTHTCTACSSLSLEAETGRNGCNVPNDTVPLLLRVTHLFPNKAFSNHPLILSSELSTVGSNTQNSNVSTCLTPRTVPEPRRRLGRVAQSKSWASWHQHYCRELARLSVDSRLHVRQPARSELHTQRLEGRARAGSRLGNVITGNTSFTWPMWGT